MSKALFAWRLFLFALFTLVAAPLEYHVKWLKPWSRGDAALSDAAWEPLVHGALFFYAVIIATEALFRIEMYPDHAARPAIWVFKIFCFVVPISFGVYLVRGIDRPVDASWAMFEVCLALGSVVLSIAVFVYSHIIENTLRSTKSR